MLENMPKYFHIFIKFQASETISRCMEKHLLETFPKCRVVGIDPIFEAGQIFREIGEFRRTSVGKSGSLNIIEASVHKNGSYVMKNVTSMPFDQILQKLNVEMIDFLLLDAEGAEYNVIPALKR